MVDVLCHQHLKPARDRCEVSGVDSKFQPTSLGNRVQASVYDPQQTLRKMLKKLYDLGSPEERARRLRPDHDVRLSYDLTRNLQTSRTEAYGTSLARTIATTWNATYRLPATITEPSGVSGVNLVTTFTYDTAGNLTKKNLTAGSVSREWNYTYNARGQVLTVDGPRTDVTDVTTIAYYSDTDTCVGCRGQVYTVTNAAGHITTFNSYDADGRPTQITDPNGVATTLTYKTRGWLASRSVGGETTSFDYDAVGNLSKV